MDECRLDQCHQPSGVQKLKILTAVLSVIFLAFADQVTAQEESWTIRCGGDYGLCGFYDRETGDQKIAPKYERILPFSQGLAAVRFEGQFGFINAQDEMVIEPRFDLAGQFGFGLAEVLVGDHVGVVNRKGEFMVEPEHARAIPIGPRAIAIKTGSWKRIHYTGRERLDNDWLAMRKADGLWVNFRNWSVVPGSRLQFQTFNPNGGELIWAGIQLRRASEMRYGLFSIARGDWWTLPQYKQVGQLSEGLVVVKTAERETLILDDKGEVQFASPYPNTWPYDDGFAQVVVRSAAGGHQYGLLSRTGQLVGNQLYDKIRRPTKQNTWQLYNYAEGRWFEVAHDGNLSEALPLPKRKSEVVPREKRSGQGALDCHNGVKIIRKSGPLGIIYGMASADGTVLIKPKFDAISCFNSGVAWAANFGDGAWCPVGPDGIQRKVPVCRTTHYPIQWSHHGPERFDSDPFTSSVMWVRAYLAFECGSSNVAPMFVGDGVQGQGSFPAIRCN